MAKKLQSFLKKLKLSESTISTLLGAAVVIIVGLLIFNYFKQSNKSAISPEAAQNESEINFEEEDGKLVPTNLPTKHKVAEGEYLWTIAEKYYGSGYNWIDISLENKLTNPDFLQVGQEINIPKVAVRKPEEVASQTTTQSLEKISADKYQVKDGDNLWDISVRAYADGYKWPEIVKANNISNPDFIEVGQELKLAR